MSQTMQDRIGSWLLEKGHTKRGLAKELGISESTLANRLNGTHGWKWREIAALSQLLGCSVAELL